MSSITGALKMTKEKVNSHLDVCEDCGIAWAVKKYSPFYWPTPKWYWLILLKHLNLDLLTFSPTLFPHIQGVWQIIYLLTMHGWLRHLSMSPDLLQEKLSRDWFLELMLPFHSVPPRATLSDFQKQANTPSWVSLSASWSPATPHLPRAIYWPPSYPVTTGYDTSSSSLLKHEIHVIFNFSTVKPYIFNIHSPAAWGEKYFALMVVRKVGGSECTWEAEALEWLVEWLCTWTATALLS